MVSVRFESYLKSQRILKFERREMARYITLVALLAMFAGCQNGLNMFGAAASTADRSAGFEKSQLNQQEQEDDGESPLMNPELATEQAPATFRVLVETTQGDFTIEVTREWSPNGADRFYNMVQSGYFKDIAIFRAIDNFMFQFGIHGDPKIGGPWADSTIQDDPTLPGVGNLEGYITFAKTGQPNSRSVQFFINLRNNSALDEMGFTPFGRIVEGAEVAGKINTEYDENPRNENVQGLFKEKGNAYIRKRFPNLDFIESISMVENE